MTINISQLIEYSENSDLFSLIKMATQSLANDDPEDRATLFEAIENALNVWIFDYECGKSNFEPQDYLLALEAMEKLSDQNLVYKWGQYYLFCTEFNLKLGEINLAIQCALSCEEKLKISVENSNDSFDSYHDLIYLNSIFPTTSQNEKEDRFFQALLWARTAIEKLNSSSFYGRALTLLYNHPFIDTHKTDVAENQITEARDSFIENFRLRTKMDPVLAMQIANYYVDLQERVTNEQLLNRLQTEVQEVAEYASGCLKMDTGLVFHGWIDPSDSDMVQSRAKFDLVNAGHTFHKIGNSVKRKDFLLVAEEFFAKASLQPNNFGLLLVYQMKSMSDRAKLCLADEDLKQYHSIHHHIKTFYSEQWEKYSNDISFLSHALEYLFNQSSLLEIQKISWLKGLHQMALASESLGQGFYWFPYEFLAIANAWMGAPEQAKLWIGRGYLLMGRFIEDSLSKLERRLIQTRLNETLPKETAEDLGTYIKQLLHHLKITQDEFMKVKLWSHPPTHQESYQWGLNDVTRIIEELSNGLKES